MGEQYRHFDHDGAPVAFFDEGAGPDVLVMVPGLPGSTRDFRWLAPELTADVRAVRIDLPGFGASPRPRFEAMSSAAFAECVSGLIDELDVPVVLVGHSSGCAVVAQVAAHRPEQVRGCALLAPPGSTEHYSTRGYGVAARSLRVPGARVVLDPAARFLFRMAGFPGYLTADERAHCMLDAAALDFAAYARNLRAMTQPTLLAWALDDQVIPVDRFHEAAELVPDGPRIEYPDGGHALQKVHAPELAAALVEFTRSLPA